MHAETYIRRATLPENSWDEATHTVRAVISTGAPVMRRDSRGPYTEVLDLSAINPEDLIDAPLLNNHRQAGATDTIGLIKSASRTAQGIEAVLRLSAADDVAPIRQRIADGTLRSLSIGYSVQQWADSVTDGQRQRTATAWRINEVSFVNLPADAGAKIRSQDMPDTIDNSPVIDRKAANAGIRAVAEAANLDRAWADTAIDDGLSVEEARSRAFEAMTSRTRSMPAIRATAPANDDPTVILARRQDALYARMTGTAPKDECRAYVHESLLDTAKAILIERGQSIIGLSRDEVLYRAQHSTSDFPNLLTGTGQRVLLDAYAAAATPLKTVCRQGSRTDFRTGSALRISGLQRLQKVAEGGEIKAQTRAEAVESYGLSSYGSTFSLTRQAIVNDDLGAFKDWGNAAGKAAADTEADELVSLLTLNSDGPAMQDGKKLFHTAHGNLATAASALSIDSLSAARLAMRTQKGIAGEVIGITPKYLLVGPALETAAESLLTSITPNSTEDVNPFGGKLQLLVEPRLTGNGWYVFSDLPVIEYSYLSGAPGPQIASREGWDVLGMEYRVVLDFGCGATDWRGAYRNAGA